MSKLYVTAKFLTLSQLTEAWSAELKIPASRLIEFFMLDATSGAFDRHGPNGDRYGIAVALESSNPYRFAPVPGKKIGLLMKFFGRPAYCDRICIAKEAAIAFAQRRQIQPPSWWSDLPMTPQLSGPMSTVRGRRKPQGVDFREQDQPLVEEMHRLLTAHTTLGAEPLGRCHQTIRTSRRKTWNKVAIKGPTSSQPVFRAFRAEHDGKRC